MDAKRFWGCVGVALALLLEGCEWKLGAPPAAHKEDASREATEPPQVVDNDATDAPEAADSVAHDVASYIQRVDGAVARHPPRPQPAADLAQAADFSEPPPTESPLPASPAESVPQSPAPVAEPTTEAAPSRTPTEPPIVIGVTARGASALDMQPAQPAGPAVNAAAIARGAPISIQEFIDHLAPPADSSFREQLDLKLLHVVAGDYDRAREPLKLVTAEQQELGGRFVEALIAIREGHMGNLAGAANTASQKLTELLESLQKINDLALPEVKICSAVRGFGQYDVLDPPRFAAGSSAEFVLYCEVRDFVSERRADEFYYTTFDLTTTILNRVGDAVHEIKDVDITDRCRNRRHDCFIPRLVRLPASLSPGQYVAKITVVDKLGQKVAENRATFQLTARP